jgi:drug/metabolite transporter (DMT)-like permease
MSLCLSIEKATNGQSINQLLIVTGQRLAAASGVLASSVTFVTRVVAVIVGVIFLGEGIAWYEPVGGAIVLLGAAMAQGRVRFKRAGK